MPKRELSSQKKADRALCSVSTANVMKMKIHEVAGRMRAAGVTEPLTPHNAKAWKADPSGAPDWFVALLAEQAARAAQREHGKRQASIEREHRMMILWEKVEKRLLAGARRFRNSDAELIAQDIAFRASKDLVRSSTNVCGQIDPELVGDLDKAALRWAGVDPLDHSTWLIHGRDCPGAR
jgi:hypothetical protein